MKSLTINPKKISGEWADGYTLDQHIKSSEFLGYDGSGRPTFDTVRTEIGEAIYQLKYGSRDEAEARKLATTAATFIKRWKVKFAAIVPIPTSKVRSVQPVLLVAGQLAAQLGVEVIEDAVRRTKQLREMKNVDVAERQKALAGVHTVDVFRIKGRNVLLFDDLFQTGATMNAVASILCSKGGAAKVFALALTRTKR